MELKEFVKEVLKEVIEAVEESRPSSARDMYLGELKDQRTVEFDVAVTAEDVTAGSGRAGVRVFSMIEGGGEASKEVKNSTVSRIKFGVNIDRWTKEEEARSQALNEEMDFNRYSPI